MYDDQSSPGMEAAAPPPPPPPPPVQRFGVGRRAGIAITTVGLLAGGVAGGYVIGHAATSSSATPAPSSSGSAGNGAPGYGPPGSRVFHPNEDPAHEKGESAQREAQENAGRFPTVP